METKAPESQLRPIARSELSLGQPLPGHLRDAQGKILIEAGETLTPNKWKLLGIGEDTVFYVGDDCPAGYSPAADGSVAEADTATAESEGRKHKRHNWKVNLRLELVEPGRGSTRNRTIDVTSQDISLGGFSFAAPMFVHVGTVVYTRLNSLEGQPVVKAVVRNCVHIEGRLHRVGVEFVKPDAADQRRMRQIH